MEQRTRPLPTSWKNTTYQQAIWRARKRLAGKHEGQVDPVEAKILEEHLFSASKPDYSRWYKNSILDDSTYYSSSSQGRKRFSKNPSNLGVDENTPRNEVITSPHQFNVQNLDALPLIGEIDYQGGRSSDIEFLKVVDQATVHSIESPRLSVPLDISTSYDHFGLCAGCFHRKGPHHHYQAPVRIGGGYSIYHRDRSPWSNLTENEATWSTIKWLSDMGNPSVESTTAIAHGFGDDYSIRLFGQYINSGGDASALKEYLDSNFNESVLDELRDAGINTQLILEYTDLYRSHVKNLLEENIEKQSKLTEKYGKSLDLAVMFASIEDEGTDMKMLLALIKRGRMDPEVIKFEDEGGNIEILEHFAQQINQDETRELIISEFEKLLDQDEQHRNAQIFLNFIKSGGDINVLKECAESGYSGSFSLHQMKLLDQCVNKFSNKNEFLLELRRFLQNNLHLYQSAELLQEFIESGGNIRTLKSFVRVDCNFLLMDDEEYEAANAGKVDLLKRTGRSFLEDPNLKKILEEFPEEPQVIETYIRSGGDFPFLVKAVSEATGTSRLEDYVKQRTDETLQKMANKKNLTHTAISVTVSSNISRNKSVLPRSTQLLPRLLDKAKADLIYDELIITENNLKENEGTCLSKTMDFDALAMTPVSAINVSDRQHVTNFYGSLISPNTSSISSVTGKKRNRLWKAPRPFEIKRSEYYPTNPQSPFSLNRKFRISSLTEDHILDAAKRQRHELDVMRRNFRNEEFRKNWQLAITSPRGSIVTANSKEEDNEAMSVLNEIKPLQKHEEPKEKAPVDRKTRRQQQREKMRAMKRENSGEASPRRNRSRASSTNSLLSVPSLDATLNIQTIPDAIDYKRISPRASTVEIRPPEPEVAQPIHEEHNKNSTVKANLEYLESPKVKPQLVISIEELTEVQPVMEKAKRIAQESDQSPRFATAFGPKVMSSSYSSVHSAKTMQKMRENPDTMVNSLDVTEQITSKSESNISSVKEIDFPRAIRDPTLKLAKARNRQTIHLKSRMKSSTPDEEEEEEESTGEKELIDMLKQYCIIREVRLPHYRRLFDKYVLVKSIREREENLLEERTNRRNKPADDIDHSSDDFPEGSSRFELRKTNFLLDKLRENIVEIQEQIATSKSEINRAIVRVASMKHGDKRSPRKEGNARRMSVFGSDRKKSLDKASMILGNLPAHVRLECESDVHVRDRKVVLVHLREKAKTLLRREKQLKDSAKRLQKRIGYEDRERGLKREQQHQFTRKQSTVYQELHPLKEDAIDPCDLREALSELDPSLTFFDHSQLIEEMANVNGVTFQVFCVVAALHEKKNLYHRDPCSLSSKINICREHYGNLLGPNLDVLRVELEAAGIEAQQRRLMIKKLSRGTSDRLDFLDFVTYVPLFIDIHSKIVSNPLPS